MKYFTKEMWLGWNCSDNTESQRAYDRSERNFREYSHQLKQLEPRLSKRNYCFFSKENLHDGRLLTFTVGDGLEHAAEQTRFNINRHDTTVKMSVLGPNLDILYTLTYRKPRRVVFDYPTTTPLFHEVGDHIGDWGYDELTAADDNYLRHEILFASGTTILIEFKQFSYSKKRVPGSRYSSIDEPTP